MDWNKLAERFYNVVVEAGGPAKAIDGSLCIVITNGTYDVALGAYSIRDWPRRTHVGEFKDEKSAYETTKLKIQEAERIIELERWDIDD